MKEQQNTPTMNYEGIRGQLDDTWKVFNQAIDRRRKRAGHMSYMVAHVDEARLLTKRGQLKSKYQKPYAIRNHLNAELKRSFRGLKRALEPLNKADQQLLDPVQFIGVIEFGAHVSKSSLEELEFRSYREMSPKWLKVSQKSPLGSHVHLFIFNQSLIESKVLIERWTTWYAPDILMDMTDLLNSDDMYDPKQFNRYHVKQAQSFPLKQMIVCSKKLEYLFENEREKKPRRECHDKV
jgi:hypothetical protein